VRDGAAAVGAVPVGVAHRQVVADGVADHVVQQQPVVGLLRERQRAEGVEGGAGRRRLEHRGEQGLGDPAEGRRGFDEGDGRGWELPEERFERPSGATARLRVHRGSARTAAAASSSASGCAVRELARPPGLALVEAPASQQLLRLVRGQRRQRELGDEPLPARGGVPGRGRPVAAREHGERGRGHRGQELRAQPRVEQPEPS
jgi:hypothetical protein